MSVVRDYLADVEQAIPNLHDAKTLVGLAGTITTVAAIEQGLAEYDRDRIHHFRLTKAAAEDVFRTLALESADERRHNPGLEPERVDVIVGGVIVLVSVLRAFDFDEVLVSEGRHPRRPDPILGTLNIRYGCSACRKAGFRNPPLVRSRGTESPRWGEPPSSRTPRSSLHPCGG